jgi:aminoglycoside phosphotransferase (APT) family kinase protein
MPEPPPHTGRPPRPRWIEVPAPVRAAVERDLGARVVGESPAVGGFSPSVASTLTLADGRRVFVKAAGPEPSPGTPRLLDVEATVLADLAGTAARHPRVIGVWADDVPGWRVLAVEALAGRVPDVRRPGEFAALADAVRALAGAPVAAMRSVGAAMAGPFGGPARLGGWAEVVTGEVTPPTAAGLRAAHARTLATPPVDVDDATLHRWIGVAAELERDAGAATAGACLVHGDIRPDNALLGRAGAVTLVDWAWASQGAGIVDAVLAAAAVTLAGGPAPQEVFVALCADARTGPTGRVVDPALDEAVDVVIAAAAGHWWRIGSFPSPPGMPTVRAFQRAEALVLLGWLVARRRR